MDTLIFLTIFAAFLAMRAGRRRLALGLFGVALLATLVLFGSHLTNTLPLNF